jgi:hypothetical protein
MLSMELATIARHLNKHDLVDEMAEWFLFAQPSRCERMEFDPADWSEIVNLAVAEARAAAHLPALPDPALLLEPGDYHRNSPNRIADGYTHRHAAR